MNNIQQQKAHNARTQQTTADLRHSLENVASSLRILEGGYLEGWITPEEVGVAMDAIGAAKSFGPDETQRLTALRSEITSLLPAAASAAPMGTREVWVCDDDWSIWERVLTPLFQRSLGVQVRGFSTRAALRQHLTPQATMKIATLLHDVHFQPPDQDLRAQDLKNLREDRPVLDVTLFTSELEDGLLVREAGDAGYRTFFKELDPEPGKIRDTAAYASKLVKIVNQALEATTARAVYHLATISFPQVEQLRSHVVTEAKELLNYLRFFVEDPLRPVVLMIAPLLEKQLTRCYRRITGGSVPRKATSEIDWKAAEAELGTRLLGGRGVAEATDRAYAEWLKACPIARGVRNRVVHVPMEEVTDPKQPLPSIGLILPIIAAMSALYRFELGLNGHPAVSLHNYQQRLDAMRQLAQSVISASALPLTLRAVLEQLAVSGAPRPALVRERQLHAWLEQSLKIAWISKDLGVNALKPRRIVYTPVRGNGPAGFDADLIEATYLQEILSACLLSTRSDRELGAAP